MHFSSVRDYDYFCVMCFMCFYHITRTMILCLRLFFGPHQLLLIMFGLNLKRRPMLTCSVISVCLSVCLFICLYSAYTGERNVFIRNARLLRFFPVTFILQLYLQLFCSYLNYVFSINEVHEVVGNGDFRAQYRIKTSLDLRRLSDILAANYPHNRDS